MRRNIQTFRETTDGKLIPVLSCGHEYGLPIPKGTALEKDDLMDCAECDKPSAHGATAQPLRTGAVRLVRPHPLDAPVGRLETQASITEWADNAFGEASHGRLAARANKEMAELLMKVTAQYNDPSIPEEIADVFICLYRLADRFHIDVHDEVDKKMAINRQRKWKVDAHGCAQHE